jgi:DNA mismatch repair protein MutS
VIFLHEVRPGAADRSYGVQVAKLAGCRLGHRTGAIRAGGAGKGRTRGPERSTLIDDLPLFSVKPQAPRARDIRGRASSKRAGRRCIPTR